MNKTINTFLALAVIISLGSCKDDDKVEPSPSAPDIPEFYSQGNGSQPSIIEVAGTSTGISKPTDLDFNPTRDGELWVLNEGTENTGGSTVMLTGLNSTLVSDYRRDGNAWHFMAYPTALSFSETGDWATSTGILDANRQGGTFTGPSLWSGDLSIYAKPSGGNGSHLDMLHGSPYSMGITSEQGNAYWVFDGYNQHIARYDFSGDHGPGNADHDDGIIQRFTNVSVKKNGSTPSHLVMDANRNYLYVVDGGNRRVLKVDVLSANRLKSLPLTNEVLADHSEWNIAYEVLVEDNFFNYCGIAINGDRLFLGDYNNGNIRCIDLTTNQEIGRIETGIPGMTGLAIYNNQLYFVSYMTNALYKIQAR
ncbi:MAG: hypothetical protein KJP21_05470 [Bacteroidia bacterium]|nr:hypothetical protein [Bacteroidia bacterium]